MNNNYYKFISRFLLLTFLLVIFDTLVGKSLAFFFLRTKNQTIAKMNYSFYETKADILIFGSSRGEGHYIPQIIKDSTGLECFNTSLGGEGVFYSYALLTNIISRYNPKIVVFDLSPNVVFDPAAIDKLSILLPYHNLNKEIQTVVELKGIFEKYKLWSSIYPYNSLLVNILTGIFKGEKGPQILKGYKPEFGSISYEVKEVKDEGFRKIDNIQIVYFKKFMRLCTEKNISVFVIVSPKYYKAPEYSETVSEFKKITSAYNQVFIDDFYSRGISDNPKYFKDPIHLNNKGAELFSRRIAGNIKQELSK